MLVELIIDKEDYKQVIKRIDFKASNGIEVLKRSLKANGKDNYYFKIYCPDKDLESAKALSEIRCIIENEFKTNGIDDYRILTDESSQYFTEMLYPFIMEFETKLRKFIHNTLFDISELSAHRVVAQLITSLKIDKNVKDIPKFDFLELATLEKIYLFLFQNNVLYGDIGKYLSDEKNRCATKKELLDFISNNENDTIWNEFFAPDFADSTLPKTFESIIDVRNDVMHFHYISFTRYDEGVQLIKSAIQDLDKQIKKGIVIENTIKNVDKLSSNIVYQQSVLLGLRGLDEIRGIINSPSLDALLPISVAFTDLSRLSVPTLNATMASIVTPFDSVWNGLPKLDGLNAVVDRLGGVSPINSTLLGDPLKVISQSKNNK